MGRYEFRSYLGGYAKTENRKRADQCWNIIKKFANERGYEVIRFRSPNKGQFYLDNHSSTSKDWPYCFKMERCEISKADRDLNERYWILEKIK